MVGAGTKLGSKKPEVDAYCQSPIRTSGGSERRAIRFHPIRSRARRAPIRNRRPRTNLRPKLAAGATLPAPLASVVVKLIYRLSCCFGQVTQVEIARHFGTHVGFREPEFRTLLGDVHCSLEIDTVVPL